MGLAVKTFNFASDAESLTEVGDSASIAFDGWNGTDQAVGFSTTTADLTAVTERARQSFPSKNDTWEDWGVPAGASVKKIQVTGWKKKVVTNTATRVIASTLTIDVVDDANNPVTSTPSINQSSTGTAVDSSYVEMGAGSLRDVLAGKQASNTEVFLELEQLFSTTSSTPLGVFRYDAITIEMHYTPVKLDGTTAGAATVTGGINQVKFSGTIDAAAIASANLSVPVPISKLVDHLAEKDASNLFIDLAYGLHVATGDLCKSALDTTPNPNERAFVQHKLGKRQWNRVKALWWKGFNIAPDDFFFHDGRTVTSFGDPVQGIDDVFRDDLNHNRQAWIRAELPAGEFDADIENVEPDGLVGIFETLIVQNYDTAGNELGESYSANPARVVADLILIEGGISKERIDWPAWCAWRDYCEDLETVDYRTLTDFDGFGLTSRYYSDQSLSTLHATRIDAVIEFLESSGAPAVGLDADDFSARYEGFVKPDFSETYTLYLEHDGGAKLWIDDVLIIDEWNTTGTHSDTVALSVGTYHKLKVEWKDDTGNAKLILQWESASQVKETIPTEALYPSVELRPRYESHVFFSSPTRIDDAVRTVLGLCNSWYQQVDGKYSFFSWEQMTSSGFHFKESENYYPNTLEVSPIDKTQARNSWSASCRDLDSQYIETIKKNLIEDRPDLMEAAGRRINGEALDLFNMTRWQAIKVLKAIVAREVDIVERVEFRGNAETYPVQAGDRVKLDLEFRNETETEFLVREVRDESSESTADDRGFVLQRWTE